MKPTVLLTIDFVARSARCRMGGSDHICCLESNGDHEVMNLLEIKFCHGGGNTQRINFLKLKKIQVMGFEDEATPRWGCGFIFIDTLPNAGTM